MRHHAVSGSGFQVQFCSIASAEAGDSNMLLVRMTECLEERNTPCSPEPADRRADEHITSYPLRSEAVSGARICQYLFPPNLILKTMRSRSHVTAHIRSAPLHVSRVNRSGQETIRKAGGTTERRSRTTRQSGDCLELVRQAAERIMRNMHANGLFYEFYACPWEMTSAF